VSHLAAQNPLDARADSLRLGRMDGSGRYKDDDW
jgi:hypothetical protein